VSIEQAVATAEAFREWSGATRVVLLLDHEGKGVLVESTPDSLTVTQDDTTTEATATAQPVRLHRLTPVPASAISLDPETGELSAPLGTIEHLAQATLDLATAFGGRTVATAEFATRDPELPITFAAREGERVVLGAGDAQFEL
jgi:hypothetical protein